MRNSGAGIVGYTSFLFVMAVAVSCYFSYFIGYRGFVGLLILLIIFTLGFKAVPGDSFKFYRLFVCSVFVLFCCCVLRYIAEISPVKLGIPRLSVKSVTGTVVYDSSFSKSGNHIMTVYLNNADSYFGQTVSSSGLVTALGKQKAIISSGLKVRLSGSFKENGIFVYDGFQVLDRNVFNTIRERLIVFIEKRIFSGSDNANLLSMMLLTGRSEIYGSEIKDLATSCGCLHILALSGMHLHFVTYPAHFFKNRFIRYFLTALSVLGFVFLAGPRPSLVRSAIMVLLCFIPIKERLAYTFVLHAVIFPVSFLNMGSIYGYTAVFALVFFSEYLGGFRPLATSMIVLVFSVPIQMLSEGQWYPVAVIAAPIVSVFAFLSMFFGFLICCIGHFPVLEKLNDFVYRFIIGILEHFSTFPSSDWLGYVILVAVVVILVFLPVVRRHVYRKHSRKFFSNESCSQTH